MRHKARTYKRLPRKASLAEIVLIRYFLPFILAMMATIVFLLIASI